MLLYARDDTWRSVVTHWAETWKNRARCIQFLTVVPILLHGMYNPVGKHNCSRNNTEDERRRVEREDEDEDEKRKVHELLDEGVKGMYIFLIAVFSLNMIINMLLIIGAKKEKPLFLNIWIIVNSVLLMTSIVVIVMSVFMLFLDWKLALMSMKSSFLCAVLTSYFIIVVNSLYHQMDRRQVAPRDDPVPPIVFIIDPPPPMPPDPSPPPYASDCEPFQTQDIRGMSST
ncbi:uncharacterized protein LOC110840517 isoform X4 [Zootermopsis nevadensis]|uniref:uncharacterized protein LOC110840517 isoform X4 n=1 Tax=Zootermopsis nevadensis TaxID=136037 RepID=UPI000B8ECD02|nr:uncharacterized protein LOC110840517 isoform X4 [Zootermopsis nevadensis]